MALVEQIQLYLEFGHLQQSELMRNWAQPNHSEIRLLAIAVLPSLCRWSSQISTHGLFDSNCLFFMLQSLLRILQGAAKLLPIQCHLSSRPISRGIDLIDRWMLELAQEIRVTRKKVTHGKSVTVSAVCIATKLSNSDAEGQSQSNSFFICITCKEGDCPPSWASHA